MKKIELENVEITPKFLSGYGRDTRGVKNGRAKLTEDDIREIISLIIEKKKNSENYCFSIWSINFNNK